MEDEPTHALPKGLVEKLIEAKEWHDRRDRDTLDADELRVSAFRGADLLDDIVEIIDETWGFAKPWLEKSS
jgi:hypothetical protein